MTAKVYIETSIPSFYYEVRTAPNMVARKEWTRQWWNAASKNYFLVTSVTVLDELSRGNRRVNAMLGLYIPMLVTPLELMGEQNAIES